MPSPGDISRATALRSKIFSAEGLLRGVSYRKPSGQRGPALIIGLNRRSDNPLTTSLGLGCVDFFDVWDDLVDLLAAYHGVPKKHPLRDEMVDSAHRFLKAKNLRTRRATLVFAQVESADEAPQDQPQAA